MGPWAKKKPCEPATPIFWHHSNNRNRSYILRSILMKYNTREFNSNENKYKFKEKQETFYPTTGPRYCVRLRKWWHTSKDTLKWIWRFLSILPSLLRWESVFFWRSMPVHDHFTKKVFLVYGRMFFHFFFIFSTVGTKTRFLPTNTKFLVEQKHKPK